MSNTMYSKYLLPPRFRIYGWILFVPMTILGIAVWGWDFEWAFLELKIRPANSDDFLGLGEVENFTNEVAMLGVLIALMFIAFSRETVEDEYIAKLRLDSLLIAVLVNYAIVFLAIVALYGFSFLDFLLSNMYTVLILFIIRFTWVKFRERKTLEQ